MTVVCCTILEETEAKYRLQQQFIINLLDYFLAVINTFIIMKNFTKCQFEREDRTKRTDTILLPENSSGFFPPLNMEL